MMDETALYLNSEYLLLRSRLASAFSKSANPLAPFITPNGLMSLIVGA
jgi:hypothetical protein